MFPIVSMISIESNRHLCILLGFWLLFLLSFYLHSHVLETWLSCSMIYGFCDLCWIFTRALIYTINGAKLIFSVIKVELQHVGEFTISNLDKLLRLWWHPFSVDCWNDIQCHSDAKSDLQSIVSLAIIQSEETTILVHNFKIVDNVGDWLVVNNDIDQGFLLFSSNVLDYEDDVYNPNIIIYILQMSISFTIILISCLHYYCTLVLKGSTQWV